MKLYKYFKVSSKLILTVEQPKLPCIKSNNFYKANFTLVVFLKE